MPLNQVSASMTVEGLTASGVSSTASSANIKLSGDALQTVSSTTGAVATGTTTIPHDDTIPQITEGDQYLSLAITPTSASSILDIDVQLQVSHSVANAMVLAGLFQDNTANALAAACQTTGSNTQTVQIHLRHRMTAGTTSATTFRVRAGSNSAGTTTVNGASGARIFGGVYSSYITITEYKA